MSARRDVVFVINEFRFSERRSCGLLDLERGTYRYESRPDHNEKLREELVELARQDPRFGYRRLWTLLTRRKGWDVDPKRVHRLYRKEGLAVRRLRRKRSARPIPADARVTAPNQEWALDFVHDSVARRPRHSCADAGGRFHARVSGDRSGFEPWQPASNSRA